MTLSALRTARPRSDEELLALVPQALRYTDVEQAFWLGVLKGPARIEAYLDARAAALREAAYKGAEAPAAIIRQLAATVGLGPDLPIVAELTEDELRRLLSVAVALWKQKGTDTSWRSVLSYLAPTRVLILDWFHHRTIEGSSLELHLIPEPGTAPGGNYDYPEFVTDLWIVDPNEIFDLERLGRVLTLFRAANERINFYRAAFVEDLRQGVQLWEVETPADGRYSSARVALVARDNCRFVCNPDDHPDLSTVLGYHVFWRLGFEVEGELWVGLTGTDLENGYKIRLIPGDPSGLVTVSRVVGGVAIVIGSGATPGALVEGYRYRWSVDVDRSPGKVLLRVRLEADEIVALEDTNANRYFWGRWGWGAGDAVDTEAELDAVLVFVRGVVPLRIGPQP